jgi:DUF4097 and DUF4098 domain-containing protein YvlB
MSTCNRFIVMGSLVVLATPALAAQSRSFSKTVDAAPNGTVTVGNVAGSVRISGWDRAQVEVTGQLGAHVERVDVLRENNRTVIRVVLPRNASRDSEANLTVRVPKASDLETSTVSADVTVADVNGSQRLKSVSGTVQVRAMRGAIEVNTLSGDVELNGSTPPQRASLRISTVSGDVEVERGAGSVEVTTVSGNIGLALDPVTGARARSTSGDIELTGSLARNAALDAESISGDIEIRARSEGGFRYDLGSFSGKIRNCRDSQVQGSKVPGTGIRSNGSSSDGGTNVRLKTMSGDISLCLR